MRARAVAAGLDASSRDEPDEPARIEDSGGATVEKDVRPLCDSTDSASVLWAAAGGPDVAV